MVKKIIEWIKIIILLINLSLEMTYVRFKVCGKQLIVLISTPTHGNLGDHAIVFAERLLLSDIGITRPIEISEINYHRLKKYLPFLLRKKDILLIDGGGNIGTLWREPELRMRDIVMRFPNNPIFIFPQTAYYEDSEYGRSELKLTARIYNAHKNLTLFCRDKLTYQLAQQNFQNVKIYFVPDIVPYIRAAGKVCSRQEYLLCFRDDQERTMDDELRNGVYDAFCARGDFPVRHTSTVLKQNVRGEVLREDVLQKKWDEFSRARIVVTDRLHGMIFAAITGTPCVAIDNASHKIKYGYEWLKPLPYIYLAETQREVYELIEKVLSNYKCYVYDETVLDLHYEMIRKAIIDVLAKED